MVRTDLNLRHLKAFSEVARCQSISAASEHVHLSQPAITQALAKLERTLQAPLFVRKSGGMFLTEPGSLFLNRVERALSSIKTGARRAARNGNRGRAGGFSDFDRLLTSSQLRTLLPISEAGNFSLAARNLGVSQPSLHRVARDLERLSGLLLFDKTAQGISLTPAARTLMQFAELAFSELDQGREEIDAWRGLDAATIVVGTLPLARTHILPKAINELTRLRPDVQVSVVDGPYDELLHGLRHGQIDLLIGALRDPVPIDDVVQHELFQDVLAIAARSDHRLVAKRGISVDDLSACSWVAPRQGTPTRHQFDRLFERAGVEPPRRLIESSSLILIRGLLLGSDRLTMISAHQIQHEIDQGLVRRLDVDLAHTSRPIGITVRRDWQPTATQTLIMDRLRHASQEITSGRSPI